MKLGLPLYAKILMWLGFNLVLLMVVWVVLLSGGLSWESVVSGPLGERPQAVAGAIANEIEGSMPRSWNGILESYSKREKVSFTLYRPDGMIIAGERTPLPKGVAERIPRRFSPGPRPGDARPRPTTSGSGDARGLPPPPGRVFAMHAAEGGEGRYWFSVRIPMPAPGDGSLGLRPPGYLIVHTPSLLRFASYVGLTRWVPLVGGMALLSALIWWPLVGTITRRISRLNQATLAIAKGQLSTRVKVGGRDELSQLGDSINAMAERLERFVAEERRFMGDVAHELASPLARGQVALSLLERRVDEGGKESLADVREEVEQMSGLVSELLAFSKAAIRPRGEASEALNLADLVNAALARERAEREARVEVDHGLMVLGDVTLLVRAIGNLVRNAIKYGQGSCEIVAVAHPDSVDLEILDNGPGVSEEALVKLGNPFFRPDTARARETGGVGLGLAIVKTCVEVCGGTVTFKNRMPHGFAARLTLRRVVG